MAKCERTDRLDPSEPAKHSTLSVRVTISSAERFHNAAPGQRSALLDAKLAAARSALLEAWEEESHG